MELGAQVAGEAADTAESGTRPDDATGDGQRRGAVAADHGGHGDPPGFTARAGRVVRSILPALAVYAAVRVVGLIVLALLARHQRVSLWTYLMRADGGWLLGIVRRGYDPLGPIVEPGRPPMSNIAFFPLYPGLVKVVGALPGVNLTAAALFVTAVSGLAAAAGLARFGERLAGGRTAGLVLVVLWAAWPHSVVLVMAYSEALFVALVVWSLVCLLEERWLWAGVLSLLAGATRAFGLALAAAIAVAALLVLVRALREHRPRDAARPVLAALIAPLGQFGYWGWLWLHTGRPDAWFYVQRTQWRSTFDGGVNTLQVMSQTAMRPTQLVVVVCMLLILASIVLLVALAVDGAPLPVLVYSAIVVLIVFGDANYQYSKARFLLAAFPLLLVPVRALAGMRLRTVPVLLGGVVLLSAWYNAYVLLLWPRSP
ncbi:MAG TPA: hypothetical protein VE781_00495 [Kineosporiaceae bacterium]|jgi:hypothetical protein|nr:hypothetical protein [Kineosporiaceae bacterium]